MWSKKNAKIEYYNNQNIKEKVWTFVPFMTGYSGEKNS